MKFSGDTYNYLFILMLIERYTRISNGIEKKDRQGIANESHIQDRQWEWMGVGWLVSLKDNHATLYFDKLR